MPKVPRKAYVPITIGSLLISAGFLLLGLYYGSVSGAFWVERTLPPLLFASELEAITSSVYSIPEEIEIEYRGTRMCRWDNLTESFACRGGAYIEEVGAVTSYTIDPTVLDVPITLCVYWDLKPLFAKLLKPAAKIFRAVGGRARGIIFWAPSKLRGLLPKRGTFTNKFIDFWRGLWDRLRVRMGEWIIDHPRFAFVCKWKALKICELYEKVPRMLKGKPNWVIDFITVRSRAGKFVATKWIARYPWPPSKWIRFKHWLADVMTLGTAFGVVKEGYRAGVRFASCRSDNILWDIPLTLIAPLQIVLKSDTRITVDFYDFYVGKVGGIWVNYSYGTPTKYSIARLFALNGADMCWLEKFLISNAYNDTPQGFPIREGRITFRKTRSNFDTLCEKEDLYPVGLAGIAKKVVEVKEGGGTRIFPLYLNPSIAIVKENNMLCEKRIGRTPDGRNNSEFTIYCYDFAELNVNLSNFPERLQVNYSGRKEGIRNVSIRKVIPFLGTFMDVVVPKMVSDELGNEFWFKNPMGVESYLSVDMPILSIAGEALGWIPLLDWLKSAAMGLSADVSWIGEWIVSGLFEIRALSMDEKQAYYQSRYDKFEITVSEVGGEIYISAGPLEPVIFADWQGVCVWEGGKCLGRY